MNNREHTYAAYRGDEFLDIGTIDQLQEKLGYTRSTLLFARYPIALKRNPNALILVDLDNEIA